MSDKLMKSIKGSAFFWVKGITILILCFTAIPSQAQTWVGTTSSWFTNSNWDTLTQPGSSSFTYIDNSGTAQVSTNSAVSGTLYVGRTATGSVTIQNGGSITNQYTSIGDTSTGIGTVTVTGSGSILTSSISSTSSAGIVYVGRNGTGTLNVINGGDVSTEGMYIASSRGSTGNVTVDGAGSTITVAGYLGVGVYGNGTMTVSGGGKVYSGTATFDSVIADWDGSQSTATVTGSGSLWSTQTLWVGWGSPNGTSSGTLNINSAGAVTSTTANVGTYTTSTGTVTVNGGTWTVSNTLNVGQAGTGTLTLTNSGKVTASTVNLGTVSTGTGIVNVSGAGSLMTTSTLSVGQAGTGTLTITNGGDVSSTVGIVGANSGSNGTVTINGTGSTWTLSGGVTVGNSGTGTLTITNGAQLATSTVSIGANSGSNGTMYVNGTTANTWNALTVGAAGTGALLINNASTLTTATAILGSSSTGIGTTTVSGATSRLVVSSNNLIVGGSGSGTLVLENGGVVTSSTVITASSSGSTGNIVLTGGTTAATWTNLTVGSGGTGTLTVTNGADLTTTTTTLGGAVGSTGTATISGTGSNLTASTIIVGGSGSGTIVINNQGTVSTGVLTLGGAAGSTGSILISGAGSTLTYTGALTVGALGSGSITLANDATFSPGATLTLGSAAGGSGTLNIGAAAGSIAAAGGNIDTTNISTAVGGTGAIQFNHTATSGSPYYLTNDHTNGGTAVNIRGGTSLIQNGGYTVLKATGTYDYTGTTTVSGGTLSNAANISNTTKFIVNGGTLLNGGTVTTANSTFSGGTVSNSGTYNSTNLNVTGGSVSNSGTLATTNTTVSAGALTTSGTFTTTNLDITGGTVNASGTLNAPNTRINGGTLLLNTDLTSTITVSSGALIVNSSRTITGNVGVSNGTFATSAYYDNTLLPSNVTLSNNLTMGSGSTTALRVIDLGPGNVDFVHVTGTATLAGTLALNFNNSTGYIPKKDDSFTVINAGAFSGNYTNFSNTMQNYFIFTTGSFSGNDYTVTISMAQKSFTASAVTGNQMSVAQALNSEVRPGSPMQAAMDYINTLPESSWGHAFDLIAPEEMTAVTSAGMSNATSLYNMLGNRFTEVRTGQRFSDSGLVMWDPSHEFSRNSLLASNGPLPAGYQPASPSFFNDSKLGLFVSGQGTYGDVSAKDNIDGYNFDAGGLILGVDYQVAEHTVVGLYGGYQGTDTNLSNNGNAKTDSGKFGLYVSQWWEQGAWINASIGGGYNSYNNKRAALGDFANSTTTGMEFNFQYQQGYDFHVGRWTFGPTMQMDYTRLNVDGYTESGSLAPLTIASQTAESLQGTIGGRVSTSIDVNRNQWKVQPYANVGLRHEFMDTTQAVTASFADGSGGNFIVDGPKVDANSLVAGFGVTLQLSPRWSGQLGYFAQANEDYLIQSISGSLVFRF